MMTIIAVTIVETKTKRTNDRVPTTIKIVTGTTIEIRIARNDAKRNIASAAAATIVIVTAITTARRIPGGGEKSPSAAKRVAKRKRARTTMAMKAMGAITGSPNSLTTTNNSIDSNLLLLLAVDGS